MKPLTKQLDQIYTALRSLDHSCTKDAANKVPGPYLVIPAELDRLTSYATIRQLKRRLRQEEA